MEVCAAGKVSRSKIETFSEGLYRRKNEPSVLPAGPPPMIATSQFMLVPYSAFLIHVLMPNRARTPNGGADVSFG